MQRSVDAIIALVALAVALVAAYLLDWGTFALLQLAARTFNLGPSLWLPALGRLVLAVGLVGLVWWQATRASYWRPIDGLYVLAGLAATLYLAVIVALHLPLPMLFNGSLSAWTTTGAVLTVAGLFHLFRRPATD